MSGQPDLDEIKERFVAPGGVVELGRTPEHAVVREVLEEIGVRSSPGC
ncbi:NUDIX domain-containing protein [Planotetraspora thailandica]|nr:NUDIX domain-containing protein [Planotetraspora thailandica]